MSGAGDQIARCNLSVAAIERRFGRSAADQAVQALAPGVDPFAEFGLCRCEFSGLVQPGQGCAGNRPGVVVKRNQRIELCLAGGRAIQRTGHFAGEARQIGLKPGIALRLGPDRAARDPFSGRAPADRPGIAAGAGIGIGFEAAVGPQSSATLKLLDECYAI